jgi:hypothetical protein
MYIDHLNIRLIFLFAACIVVLHLGQDDDGQEGDNQGLGGSSLVEDYAKTITNVSFLFCDCSVQNIGTCNTPLERCFQDLSNGILQAPKFLKFQLVKPNKICSRLATA